jgi:hypothetical protein
MAAVEHTGQGVCAVVFFVAVPETKDRSLEQIQADLGTDAEAPLTRDRDREDARVETPA